MILQEQILGLVVTNSWNFPNQEGGLSKKWRFDQPKVEIRPTAGDFISLSNQKWDFHIFHQKQRGSIPSGTHTLFVKIVSYWENAVMTNPPDGSLSSSSLLLVGGLEHVDYFSIYWECHHPNWQTHIFQRGRAQPPISLQFLPTNPMEYP